MQRGSATHRNEPRLGPRTGGRGSIGAHLVALVAIQLILVWGLIAFAASQDFHRARSDAEAQAATTARLAAEFVVEELDVTYQGIAELPSILEVISLDALCEANEQDGDESDRWVYLDSFVLRTDGSPACPSDAGDPNVADASWFHSTLASSETIVDGPLSNPINGEHSMIYAVAVPDADLVVAYSVRLASIGTALDKQFGVGPTPTSFLVASKDGSIEISSSGAKTGRTLSGSGFARRVSEKNNTFEDLTGVERIFADAPIADVGWRLFAGTSTSDAFAGAKRALTERIVFAVVLLLIVLAAAVVLQRRFLRPIRSLVAATKRFRDGDHSVEVVSYGPTELSALGESFNEMMHVRATAEKALQKAVKAEQNANAELREIDGLRKAFLMAISHELRTPLTAIVGYAALMNEGLESLSKNDIDMSIKAIVAGSERLERLLIDLLDIERLSRGVIEPKRRDLDVREMVLGVVDRSGAGDRIRADVKASVRAFVDPALTERILENLVSNAVRHTPSDSKIWVKASRVNGNLRICVEDNGPGVPDAKKLTVFEVFSKGTEREHSPGTGVGLTLVSQFSKLQGGRAWLEDRAGGGASFRVEIPAVARGEKPTKPVRRRREAALTGR